MSNFRSYPLPCNYWIVSFEEHKQIKNKLLDCLKTTEKYKDKNITELDYELTSNEIIDTPEYQKLFFKYFNRYIDKFVEPFKQIKTIGGYEVNNCWFQKYYENDYHDWHIHPYSNLSFVYYLQLTDPVYATEFFFPEINSITIKAKDVKEGDVLIFPSQVSHRSPVYTEANSHKIIIAFNLTFFEEESI